MERFDLEPKQKRYCIRGKHAALICLAVVVTGVAVGLGVGLSQNTSSTNEPTPTTTTTTTPTPTEPPGPDPSRGPCKPSNNTNGGWTNFRLPDYITPVHYELHLEPNLETDVYTGIVAIHLNLTKASTHLWLHIRETFVSLMPTLQLKTPTSTTNIELKGCFEYTKQEYVVVEATKELRATGTDEYYILTLHFQGWLNGSLVGFYKTTYVEGGETKKIAATDHEPTDARKSFPCFDEPNKKATFKISITHDQDYEALSNMPEERVDTLPGQKKKTTFKTSVKMSTYLVCFAVHRFNYVEQKSKSNITLRIYAQPSQIHTAEYAANVTKVIFDYFEEYFDMEYSIEKLDKIAIPDFGTGAMENWGLITYRESNLLYDEKESSSYNKQRVASVIAHELVHQWFGNIVTMDWWDDLWLNEGFASFFEYVGVEAAEPSWGMRDIMLIDDVFPVLVDDALLTSHPIIVNVSTPAEITSVFDAISYSKGASILRMLEGWMGRDKFRDGCRKYLKSFQFQNAKTSDFWKAQTEVSGFDVAGVMDTWTKQMGYPVLSLTSTNTEAKLTQKRFLLDPNADPTQPSSPLGYKWTIPVQWNSHKTNKNGTMLFDKSETEVIIENFSPATDGPIKVNNDHMGFYRVNHPDDIWAIINQQLLTDHLVFSAADRSSYIDDIFALARADIINYNSTFELLNYLGNETDYIVWDRVASSIAYVSKMLASDNALYSKFQKLFQRHVEKISRELGWEDVGDQTKRLLRETVLDIACQMGDAEVLAEASAIFKKWINGTVSSVPVNLRLLVYQYGMKNAGTEASWEVMFEQYLRATLAQEKDKLLYGLASIENVSLLNRLLEASKNESIVRSQDLFTLVRYVALNKYGESMAWDWVTLNWDYLVKRYTITDRNLGRLLNGISTSYNTELQLWKMEHFFALHPNAGAGETPRKQALERVKSNIKWVKSNLEEIQSWLNANVS
ncbi:LOW QUALITY PROTEIN: glutamyl aminopeptidase [Silurus meridionalis]|uniref:LOW QUALITY PROTEIN: glutamyl aminopeptidase n=1 Tax=Silurus meridionalis TaxID=175797 RepID=UPI001EEB245C|nr:LOW QUALITY PROTEIN: glutamyl aminopeptidase [Silurus meridionalis]